MVDESLLSKAGDIRRPPIDEPAEMMRELAYRLIRVLDAEGRAVGPWAPEISEEALREGLRDMLKVRAYDTRMTMAQRQGKTSFYMQALGEEAIACAFARALRPGDMHFPTYRQQGLLIANGCPVVRLMNQIYSNTEDPLQGRQMPVFYSERDYGYFSISGNLASQYIQAVGWAMAQAMDGKDGLSVGWIGEGATAESDFYSAMLFASTYRPPVILNIVNNQWAISSRESLARGSSPTFAARGVGFGLPALRVDGNDYLAVYAAAKWAAERARAGLGPTAIEFLTYRTGAHSTSDDPSAYRPKNDSEAWPLGDPVDRLKQHLIAQDIWTEERHAQAVAEIDIEIAEAQKQAEKNGTLHDGPHSSPATMFEDVYKEMPLHLRRQRQEAGV